MYSDGARFTQGTNWRKLRHSLSKRHMKAGAQGARQAGIVELEAAIHISNVALVDPKTDKPTRVGIRTLPDGSRVRFAKRSGEQL